MGYLLVCASCVRLLASLVPTCQGFACGPRESSVKNKATDKARVRLARFNIALPGPCLLMFPPTTEYISPFGVTSNGHIGSALLVPVDCLLDFSLTKYSTTVVFSGGGSQCLTWLYEKTLNDMRYSPPPARLTPRATVRLSVSLHNGGFTLMSQNRRKNIRLSYIYFALLVYAHPLISQLRPQGEI